MFTVDVEEYFCVTAFEKVIPQARWNLYSPRVDENIDYILDALERYKATGTFFILGWLAERNPGLVRRIAKVGHEVASHGYSHRRIHNMSRQEFSEDVKISKDILEQILGDSVKGYRAPSFSVTNETLWALEVLSEQGFLYDSSIFPVYRGSYGIPTAQRVVGKISVGNGESLYEVPLPCIDSALGRIPVGGGAYLRWFPYWITEWGLRRINVADKIPFVVYLHPWELDLQHPVVEGIGWFTKQRHYLGIRGNRDKLERLLGRFSFESIIKNISDSCVGTVPSKLAGIR